MNNQLKTSAKRAYLLPWNESAKGG